MRHPFHIGAAGLMAGIYTVTVESQGIERHDPILSGISGSGRDVLAPARPALASGAKLVIVGAGLPAALR
jgi:hypothetical protein